MEKMDFGISYSWCAVVADDMSGFEKCWQAVRLRHLIVHPIQALVHVMWYLMYSWKERVFHNSIGQKTRHNVYVDASGSTPPILCWLHRPRGYRSLAQQTFDSAACIGIIWADSAQDLGSQAIGHRHDIASGISLSPSVPQLSQEALEKHRDGSPPTFSYCT